MVQYNTAASSTSMDSNYCKQTLSCLAVLLLLAGVTVAATPSAIAIQLQAGDVRFAQSEYSLAATHYTLAMGMDSLMPLPYTKRAAVYIKLGKHAKAIQDLVSALKAEHDLNPGQVFAEYCEDGDINRCVTARYTKHQRKTTPCAAVISEIGSLGTFQSTASTLTTYS